MNDDLMTLPKGFKLAIEYGAKMRLEIAGVLAPQESRMVGMENNFIIVTTPPNPQGILDHKLFAGNEVLVRCFSQGTVYSFQTKLNSTITSPIPLIFLEYPQIVQSDKLRSKERITCMMPATFTYKEDEKPGVIVDLSTTGCRCIINEPGRSAFLNLDIEKTLFVLCKFPGSKVQLPIHGIVRNINKSKRKIDFGIKYTPETSRESLKLVAWYISTIESYLASLS